MMLTLGQAAKEVGLSKTAISNAIKKGKLSATKNEDKSYSIDPSELFRVYTPKQSTRGQGLTKVNPVNSPVNPNGEGVLTEKVNGMTLLLEEKDKQIQRLILEKDKTEDLLDAQMEQAKKVTLLLEHFSSKDSGAGGFEKSFKALESRIENQEKTEILRKEREDKILRRNRALKKALIAEREKGFLEKLFAPKRTKKASSNN